MIHVSVAAKSDRVIQHTNKHDHSGKHVPFDTYKEHMIREETHQFT